MDNKLDIDLFLNFKYNKECLILDNTVIDSISNTFNGIKQKKKIQIKKPLNILKNSNLKQLKDKISNRVNLILNKISENNIDNLVVEFIENVKINNLNDFNEFIKIFYIKLLSEIHFFKFYIKFFQIITNIYENVYNYTIEYFCNIIENKFNYDYFDMIDEKYSFIKEIDEDKRLNNLILIHDLIKINYFKNSFIEVISDKMLNQTKHLSDIYYWFKNNNLNQEYILKIKNIVDNNTNIQLRDKVLLDNLTNNISEEPNYEKKNELSIVNNNDSFFFKDKKNKIIFKNQTNTIIEKSLNVELDNIYEEYIYINNSESFEDYIINNCKDASTKNKFCEFLIDKYLSNFKEESNKVLILFKKFIKQKILYKSNLSRGLLNIYSKYQNIDKLKNLLLFLKNLGITNGLETLINKYKIDTFINL